jgi:TRAP-type C4-dicarboxylate transport system permease small subunit
LRLESFRRGYESALEWVVIALMAILAVEVTAGIAFRTMGASLVWYDEVASILLAWLTFYGSALAAVKRAHIGCPELVALLPPVPKVMARILAEVLVIAFFVLAGWTGWAVLEVLATDHLVSLPSVPVSWVQSVVPLSCALIVFAEILNLPRVIADARRDSDLTGGASH